VQVESTDPKYLRWKVAWNPPDDGGATLQFGYQVMLQKTDQNKDYFSLQSAFKRPPSMQPGDALIFANQWNAVMPYAHIYVSNDSNLRLEMETCMIQSLSFSKVFGKNVVGKLVPIGIHFISGIFSCYVALSEGKGPKANSNKAAALWTASQLALYYLLYNSSKKSSCTNFWS